MTGADQEQLLLVIESRANTGGLDAIEKKIAATSQAAAAATARTAAAAREGHDAINEDIRLLAMKARAVDASNAKSVAAIRENIAAEREYMQSVHATEEQYVRLSLVTSGLEKRTNAVSTSIGGLKAGRETIHTAASAMSTLAFAAQDASMGGKAAAMALGNVAQSLSLVGTNAQFAMWASGIGAFVTVAATAVSIFQQMNEEAKASDAALQRISAYGRRASESMLADLNIRIAAATEAAANLSALDRFKEGATDSRNIVKSKEQQNLEQLIDLRDHLYTQVVKLDQAEAHAAVARNRNMDLTLAQQARAAQNEAFLNDLQLQQLTPLQIRYVALRQEADARMDTLEKSLQQYDADNRLIPVTDAQRAAVDRLKAAEEARFQVLSLIAKQENDIANIKYKHQNDVTDAGDDPQAEYKAKVQLIRDAEAEDERAGVDKVEAHRRAEAAIAKLESDRMKAGLGGYAALSKAVQGHGKILERVARASAAAIKLYEVQPLARKAIVNAKIEWAKSTSDFASGNVVGGAGHLLAAGGYVAAAAAAEGDAIAGFAGSGGGGGGGGMGSFGESTFTPNSNGNGGSVNLYLITRDPYGRDAIAQTVFELQRSGDLRRTVPIGPTSGVSLAGVP